MVLRSNRLKKKSAKITNNRLLIRQGRKTDGRALLSLIDALANFEKLKKPNEAARARLLQDTFGKNKRYDTFLAFLNNHAIGYAIYFETYSSFLALPTLYLEDIFVLPQHRHRGIGMKLFQECVAEAKRRRCGRMEWMVLDWNTNAINFYKKIDAIQLKEWLPFRLNASQFSTLLAK